MVRSPLFWFFSLLMCVRGAHFSQQLRAEDWPQWGRTPQRNMISNERGLPSAFDPGKRIRRKELVTFDASTGKNLKWVSQLGGKTYSSPVIADGRVFYRNQ